MKIYFTLFLSLIFGLSILSAQDGANFWKSVDESQISVPKNKTYDAPPTEVEHFKFDVEALRKVLQKAPMEYTEEAKSRNLLVDFPLMNGEFETFAVVESPVFAPELGAKYPNIRSFRGISINNKLNSIRFDYSPFGFHGSIQTLDGNIYIDPYAHGQEEFYIAYPTKTIDRSNSELQTSCGWLERDNLQFTEENTNEVKADRTLKSAGDPVFLRVYRLALACTGEFGQSYGGGDLEAVNAIYNTALTRLNQLWEAEVAIKMELIPDNDNLVYLDPVTDPYNNADEGRGLLNQNVTVFPQSGIMNDWYDIGHVFTIRCNDVGGVAGGTVCSDAKMRGVTCHSSNNIEATAIRVMAHEIGHQFSCGHSWNNCPGSADQLSASNAFEPGSGSTIMSYAGACGSDNNVQGFPDPYYNISSLEDFINFSRTGGGSCGMLRQTGNTEPDLKLDYENDFYIPLYTPFELTASATDAEGDALTYCWEQYGTTSVGCVLGTPTADCPGFRSFSPTTDPTRTFPQKQSLITNTNNRTEVLPGYSRDYSFTCTVRDNNPEAGATIWDVVKFKSTDTAGPFKVVFPNNLTHSLEVGKYQEIQWDVANTDVAPINAKFVDIWLSTNGGWDFTEKIVSRAINDGSEFIVVPDFVTNDARIKIKASDNIFFDISATNFEILAPSAPNFSLDVFPKEQGVCLPAVAEVDIVTGAVLDFNSPVEFSIVDGVPMDVTATLESNSVNPEEDTKLFVDFSNYTSEEEVNIVIQAAAMGVDTVFRTVTFVPVSNDYTDMALMSPADGESGLGGSPEFNWTASAAANTYSIQIATNPAFGADDIIDSAFGISANSFSPSVILDPTQLYYWRVIPENECGLGPQSDIFAFHTETLTCTSEESNDTPINISQSGTAEFVSKINILEDGTINDINIRDLRGNHEYFSDLELVLVAPDKTRVTLLKNNCLGSSFAFDLDLDQDAPSTILCPPVGTFKPVGDLDELLGKSTMGEWQLLINDLEAGSAGSIKNWSIEFCSNVNLNNPSLLQNETLPCNPGSRNTIDNDFLEVQGTDVENWQLVYTLVSVPTNGELLKEGVAMQVGDTFSQSNINWFGMKYQHDGSNTTTDGFLFTIIDGNGGWTGTHKFNIEIDENFSVSNDEVIADDLITVFPNPANDVLNVRLEKPFAESTLIELFDMNGRLIQTHNLAPGQVKLDLDLNNLNAALYFLRFESALKVGSKKFTIAR